MFRNVRCLNSYSLFAGHMTLSIGLAVFTQKKRPTKKRPADDSQCSTKMLRIFGSSFSGNYRNRCQFNAGPQSGFMRAKMNSNFFYQTKISNKTVDSWLATRRLVYMTLAYFLTEKFFTNITTNRMSITRLQQYFMERARR